MEENKELQLTNNQINVVSAKRDMMNLAFKQAQFYAQSTIVPDAYRNNASNCFIAIEMANRMGASVFQIMQSLNIIKGRPAWSSAFIIATINQSKRFKTQLNYRLTGKWKDKTLACVAFATANDGTLCESVEVNYQMAKDEGWIDKTGSKWQTMPELMIRYRAASFFGKQFCPDLLLGLMSTEEQYDIVDMDYTVTENNDKPTVEAVRQKQVEETASIKINPETGEVGQTTEPIIATEPIKEGEPIEIKVTEPVTENQAEDYFSKFQ